MNKEEIIEKLYSTNYVKSACYSYVGNDMSRITSYIYRVEPKQLFLKELMSINNVVLADINDIMNDDAWVTFLFIEDFKNIEI